MQTPVTNQGNYRWLAALTLAVAVAALLLQYVLMVGNTLDTIGPAHATLRFFSYFTILGNLLVALTTGFAVFGQATSAGRFFARARVRGGIALYIAIVCGIYFTILRHLWDPQGAQWWADSTLHFAVPVLYLAWWVLGATHGAVRWGTCLAGCCSRWHTSCGPSFTARGCIGYPYPFIDVDALGTATALRNIVGIVLLFAVVSAGLVALDHVLGRSRSVDAST